MKVKCLLAVLLLSATATAFAQEAKYGIKSAILKKEAVTMGQKVQGVQYFDDYGRKEASELTMKVEGCSICSFGKSACVYDLVFKKRTVSGII